MNTHLHDGGPVGRVSTELDTPHGSELRGSTWEPETGECLFLAFTAEDGTPILKDARSGRTWRTTWRRLVALAEAEGLTDEHEAPLVAPEPGS